MLPPRHRQSPRWLSLTVAALAAYILGSGPIIAAAFWLRDATGWNGFYAVVWLYFPLAFAGPDSVLSSYIEWWVALFGAVGPG